ncbi:MAG: carboxymuconolactone decarboxylase family protein [Candidatus Omnitrophica bacterium]|nr:carboxymuconolactone decarboxylase family protein [Candidatus Omnitrophota bacterium]
MDERTKELIAIGASVSAHCPPCLAWHLGNARELGIGEEEVRAAIETGFMVGKGASAAVPNYINGIFKKD